jgi:hypothetical protein
LSLWVTEGSTEEEYYNGGFMDRLDRKEGTTWAE